MNEGHLSNPHVMIDSKTRMTDSLEKIKTLSDQLAKDTATYTATINDAVSENAKNMINRILALVGEMKEEISARLDNVEKAARIQIKIENNARRD